MAEGVTVANAFVQIMPSMEGATDSITNAILPGVNKAGSKAGSSFGSMFTGKLGGLLKGFGAAALGYFAFDALKDSFVEVESGFNNVIKATGATGEAAEQLKDVYLDVSGSVAGSFEEIGAAVGELNTRLGLEGEALEDASEAAMKFAKVNGVDATVAIQDVSRMMNNAGISADEYAHVLDVLTVASQQSGIDVNKLAESVTANAASFRQLGFSTEESIAMLAQFEKAGVDTSSVLAGMKKGVSNWAKEGKSAQDGFAEFVSGVEDGSIDMQQAIEIFGAKAGVSMYDAAKTGQLSWDEMYSAISEGSDGALDEVYRNTLTAQEKFDILGKKVQTGFYEIIEPIVDAIEPYMDDIIAAIAEGIEFVVNDLVPKVKGIAEVLGTVIGWVKDLVTSFDNAGEKIGDFCNKVKGFFSDFETNVSDAFTGVHDAITTTLEDALMKGMELSSDFEQGVTEFFNTAASNAQAAFDSIRKRIETAIGAAKTFVLDAANNIAQALGFSNLASMVSSVFSSIEGFIKDPIGRARDFVRGIPDEIIGFFRNLGERITEAIGSIKFPTPHVTWEPLEIGGVKTVDLPTVKWFASGGFLTRATLIGAGEAGAEMVLPQSGGLMDDFSEAVASKVNGVTVYINNAQVNSDSEIRSQVYGILDTLKRKGAM